MENTNKPEKKFRAGAVSATIWVNQTERNGEKVNYRTISLERNYKDKNDQWQSTNKFRLNDLPRVALVSNKAYEFLVMTSDRSNDSPDESTIDEEIVM